MQQAHVSFEVEGVEELTQERVVTKLLQCGGAHKPNGWDFGGDAPALKHDWY